MLLQMAGYPPFSRLNDIPLCVHTTYFLSIPVLMGILDVSIPWLVSIMLQITGE